ncbi:MAG: metallophosphatase domain-containing protein [Acidobacteria bacterium]|nr:metallophosphatase domain-containing protein [Acidobacteriota bacterium]
MRIVCISDTHGLHGQVFVPNGDVLIHAGDFSNTGSEGDVERFAKWLKTLPHPWKIVVAGNHDWYFQRKPKWARRHLEGIAIYLEDSGCEIEGVRFWGSPWQPAFNDWAFNLPRCGEELARKWSQIPSDTTVLITHGPPHGTLDEVHPRHTGAITSEHLGCERLAERLQDLKPRLHVFGHIHDGAGKFQRDGTLFINASICTEAYQAINHPVVVDLET